MSETPLPSPGSEPERADLESLKLQLRALPPDDVPGNLSAKLIAAIPGSVGVPRSPGVGRKRVWVAGGAAVAIAGSVLVYSWLSDRSNNAPPHPMPADGGAVGVREQPVNSSSSTAIHEFEQAVQTDPYNADAWFRLAKAQAAENRSSDAVASAEKAIDVARSRNRNDLATAVEAWLRDYRAKQNQRPLK